MRYNKKNIILFEGIQVLIFSLGLLAHQLSQHYFHYPIPFLDHYLDPFILGVLVPYFYKWEQRILWKKAPDFQLPIWLLIGLFVLLSLLSEVLLPSFHSGYTQDLHDVLAIGLGVFWYFLLLNR
ncbi:MAG TPA: hypothetical protein VK102_08950 [Sphingobacterium sp.]|nr:hypothetical protein [Sphingobacterium sp.]